MPIGDPMTSPKNITKNLFSRGNIEYSLLFFLLSIIFFYFVRQPLLDSYLKTEIAKEITPPIIIPSNTGEFLYWLILASVFTPYIVFICKRKYEIFILGFCIPSVILTGYYAWHLEGFELDIPYIEWSLYYLIPAFILIYLLKRSKTIKEDILSITFFVFLRGIFFRVSMITHGLSSAYIPTLIFSTFFASAYLILLSFIIEKIAKVKVFRYIE